MWKCAVGLVFFVMVSLPLWHSGCGGDFPAGPFRPELPLLMDPVPFDDLAPGILVFQRIGPAGNRYLGAYGVDIRQKRSLGYNMVPIHEPAISPDGHWIAFTTYTTVPNAEDVYVMDIEGIQRRWVSQIAGHEQSPSWTPDAKRILFSCVPFNSSGDSIQLYRQSPLANPGDRELVFDTGKRNPRIRPQGPVSVSPTGTCLVGGDGIWTISSDGSSMNLLVPAPAGGKTLYSPAWSPDGKNIAALAVSRGAAVITSVAVILYAADGTSADTLVSLPASGTAELPGNNNYSLCWSPDGSQIAFTRPDGKDAEAHIFAIRKDHTGLTQVTTAPGVTDRSLSWGKEIPVQSSIRSQ